MKKISLLGLLLSLNISHADVTGNLVNQNFFNGNNFDNGWSGTNDHNHGNDTVAGVDGEYIENSISLQNNAGLSKGIINNGFTSTAGADIWFWNNIEQNVEITQTLVDDNGNVTTQTKTIDKAGSGFNTYTDSVVVGSNSQEDYEVNLRFTFNESSNSQYHYGADLKNPTLIIDYDPVVLTTEQTSQINSAVNVEEFKFKEEFVVEEFVPFEEPKLVTEMFSEVYIQEVAIEEINTGVVNVFALEPPAELEISYGNQETIEEISAEVEVPEERVEVEQTENNETRVETAESTEEIQNSGRGNERESAVESNEVSSTGGESNEESELIVRNESSEQAETNEQVAEETTESTETNVGRGNESESREDETTVRETAGDTNAEQSVVQTDTETETSVSIDVADIESQVAETVTSVNDRLVATQQIVARAMSSQSVDSYTSKNNNIFIQPLIDGGNIDDYARRNYSDDRQLYASAQDPYQDSMVQRKEKIDEAVSNRIRAEEHLRRIRGY